METASPPVDRRALALDWAGRLTGAGLFLYLMYGEWRVLRALGPRPADLAALAPLGAHLAVLGFLALASVCFLIRTPPVVRSPSMWARLAAVLGTLLLTVTLRWLPLAPLPPAEHTGAAVLITIGNLLAIAALATLGRSFSILPQARALITRGLYRFVRHPMYLAQQISILGVLWLYRSWPALILILLHLAVQLWRIEEEERLLGRVFPAYADYRRRTARLLPGIY